MKHVLKRVLTLLVVTALLTALMTAALPGAAAAETPLDSGITGLKLSYDGGMWQVDNDGVAGGTMTVAAEGCGGSTLYTPVPSALTLKNDTSQPATLSFDYRVELNSGTITINGSNITGDGSFELSMSPREEILINVISCDFAEYRTGIRLYNISFTVEEDIHVTFSEPVNGAYTVDGTAVSEQQTITKPFGSTYAVSAVPAEGYTFLGWFNDVDFTCLSTLASDSLLVTCDCVIYPYFYNEESLSFKVNDQTFTDLNTADSYASSHGHAPIVLLSDGELPAGNYVISAGNILLIPCDGEFSLCTTDPEAVGQNPNFSNTRPYRTLSLAPGASLIVNGALSLAGRQNMEMPCIGATVGDYGYITLAGGSNITVNNGGKLYCWGYITGAGTVTAKKGATVYEPFQIMDFRGGTATLNMMNSPYGVFPVSQYYVQNIESRLTLEYGARELVRSVTNAGGMITPATVPFIDRTGANALFQMDNGTTITKYYNAAEDRLCFELDGDASINTISLTIIAPEEAGGQGLTINSGDYTLPFNGNFDVEIQSGTMTLNQNVMIQPDAVITVDEGAEIYIPYVEDPDDPENSHPVCAIVYDSDDWGGFCGSSNQPYCPIRYTPSGPDNIRSTDPDSPNYHEVSDATIDVNGTITLDGCMYTTAGGANITSSEGTGKIMFNNDAPAPDIVYQVTQGNTTPSAEGVVMTSAQIHNPAGSEEEYTETAGVTAGTPFSYGTEGWTDAPLYKITYSIMGAPADEQDNVSSVLGIALPEFDGDNGQGGIQLPNCTVPGPSGYTFLGWSETELEDENPSADVLTGNYAPQSDLTLYAVFSRTENDFVKLTAQPETFDGRYLIVYEGANPIAFNSAFGTTGTALNKSGNYVSVTVSEGTIPYSEPLEAASVEIRPAAGAGHYSIRVNCGSYLGNTGGSSTGFNVNGSTVYENTISIQNGVATIQNVPTTGTNVYTLKYNATSNSDKFGFFKASTSNYHMVSLYRMGTTFYTTKLDCLHQNYTYVVTPPSCTAGGFTTNTCTDCGYIWLTAPTEATGHTFTEEPVAPTETEQGYTTFTCTDCGYSYDGNFVEALGSAYTVTFVAQGSQVGTGSYNSLHGSELPVSAPAAVGYTFRGWSATELPEEVTSASLLTGNYIPPRDNMTLYAVYVRSSEIEFLSRDYEKVANGDPIYDGGKYLVVHEAAGKAFIVSDRVDEGNDVDVTVITPDEGRKYIEATNELDEGAMTINPVYGSGAYSIRLPDARYIGNTGSSAGINANTHTVYTNRISVDANGNARIENVPGEGRSIYTLRYQNKFSFYKATNDVPLPVALYHKADTGRLLYYTTSPAPCEHRNAVCVTTNPTCLDGGYDTYTCPDCGEVWTERPTEALGHNYGSGVISAPAAENGYIGYTTYTCLRCGDSYRDNYTGVDFEITYSVLGTESDPVTVNSYDGVNLPASAEEVFGYEFVGWSEETIDPEYPAADVKRGEYHPTGDVTLYATYVHYVSSNEPEGDYVRITRGSDFASGGKILVVCETHVNPNTGEIDPVVFDTNTSTITANEGKIFSQGNYHYVSISNGVIPNGGLLACEISVKPIAGTQYFTMQVGSGKNARYIGSTGSSTGINQNTKPNYKTRLYIDSNDNAVIENVGGKHTYRFLYNSNTASDRFGFYNPNGSGATPVALYYKTGSEFVVNYTTNPDTHVHEYELYDEIPATCTETGEQTYQCICGDTYTVTTEPLGHELALSSTVPATCTEPGSAVYACTREGCDYSEETVIPATGHTDEDNDGACDECWEPMPRIISAALRLDEDIDVIYTAILPDGFESASMTFTIGSDAPVTVSGYTGNGDSTYSFVFEGVNPQRMGDNISATLNVRAENADFEPTDYTDTRAEYSVRQYCVNKLADETVSSALRTLLSDVLAYGGAAQTYMNYKTDALVNTGSDIVNPACSSFVNLSGLTAGFTGTASADYKWISAGMTLTDRAAMRFRFCAASASGLTVKIAVNGREETFGADDFTEISAGVYEITFKGIKASEFADTVTASFYTGSAQTGNTLSYSVNTYVQSRQADGNTALANLVKALYCYGASAAAFAG